MLGNMALSGKRTVEEGIQESRGILGLLKWVSYIQSFIKHKTEYTKPLKILPLQIKYLRISNLHINFDFRLGIV
jgi:hypothetical protein